MEKERREEERAERAAMREEERARRAEEREEARRQREEERAAQKEAREAERAKAQSEKANKANESNETDDAVGLNSSALGDTPVRDGAYTTARSSDKASENGAESSAQDQRIRTSGEDEEYSPKDSRERSGKRFGDNVADKRFNRNVADEGDESADPEDQKIEEKEEDKVRVKYSAFTVDEINRLDSIKPEGRRAPVADEDGDEDELAAASIFSENADGDSERTDSSDDVEEVVFSDPRDTGKRARGHSKVDDLASDLFDENNYEVDKETGEVEYETTIYSQVYELSFQKGADGVTRVQGVTREGETHLFDISIIDGYVNLTENGVPIGEIN
jgi:hypothetical protein